MRNCPKCGSYLPENSFFCPACGRACLKATKTAREHVKAEKKWDKSWTMNTVSKTIQEDWTNYAQDYANTNNEFEQHQSHNPDSEEYYQPKSETDLAGLTTLERLVSAAAYIQVLFILPFIVCPNSEFAKFHGRQGIRLFSLNIILAVLSEVIFGGAISLIASALVPLLTVIGVCNAITGRMKPLPFVGGSQTK